MTQPSLFVFLSPISLCVSYYLRTTHSVRLFARRKLALNRTSNKHVSWISYFIKRPHDNVVSHSLTDPWLTLALLDTLERRYLLFSRFRMTQYLLFSISLSLSMRYIYLFLLVSIFQRSFLYYYLDIDKSLANLFIHISFLPASYITLFYRCFSSSICICNSLCVFQKF